MKNKKKEKNKKIKKQQTIPEWEKENELNFYKEHLRKIDISNIEQELNILLLLSYQVIERYEALEAQGVVKFGLKQKGKAFTKECELFVNTLCNIGKIDNPEQYRAALNDLTDISKDLDIFLDKKYFESLEKTK